MRKGHESSEFSISKSIWAFNGHFWENKIHRCPSHQTWLLPAVTYTLHGIARESEQEFLHICLFTHFTHSRGMSASDMFTNVPTKVLFTITVIHVNTRIFICNIQMWYEIVKLSFFFVIQDMKYLCIHAADASSQNLWVKTHNIHTVRRSYGPCNSAFICPYL